MDLWVRGATRWWRKLGAALATPPSRFERLTQ